MGKQRTNWCARDKESKIVILSLLVDMQKINRPRLGDSLRCMTCRQCVKSAYGGAMATSGRI